MSLIGIDINSYDDIIDNHKKNGIRLFQLAAKHIGKDLLIHNDLIKIVVHYSYSINLAHAWNKNDWWIQQLIEEIRAAGKIKAFAIVIHTGKSINYSVSSAINSMYSSLLYVAEQTRDIDLKILIETPAGQGTELLADIEDFVNFMKKFQIRNDIDKRFGICVDTCHVYAAGYNISEKKGIESFFKCISDGVGLHKIKLVHLNNIRQGSGSKSSLGSGSKSSLGSRIDRHANLDTGDISLKSIKMIVRFINELEIPMILETPSGINYKSVLNDYAIAKNIVKQ
jgi:deoxyribonuclease-4